MLTTAAQAQLAEERGPLAPSQPDMGTFPGDPQGSDCVFCHLGDSDNVIVLGEPELAVSHMGANSPWFCLDWGSYFPGGRACGMHIALIASHALMAPEMSSQQERREQAPHHGSLVPLQPQSGWADPFRRKEHGEPALRLRSESAAMQMAPTLLSVV